MSTFYKSTNILSKTAWNLKRVAQKSEIGTTNLRAPTSHLTSDINLVTYHELERIKKQEKLVQTDFNILRLPYYNCFKF